MWVWIGRCIEEEACIMVASLPCRFLGTLALQLQKVYMPWVSFISFQGNSSMIDNDNAKG